MHHPETLITTLVAAFVLAFVLGLLAHRIRLSPLVGYLLAGVLVGPFTPGYVADASLAKQLAEIGIILLMFGVGLHFSLRDLWAVRGLSLPGALSQMAAATGLGYLLARHWDYPAAESLVFGFSLSVASTVVLLRALEERNAVGSQVGRVVVGWLVVEDVAMILALVVIPALGGTLSGHGTEGGEGLGLALVLTIAKVGVFVALMLVVGSRVLPWLLVRIARTESRELMTLGGLAVALGLAYGASAIFDASFALGAFLAGVVLNESPIGHETAERSLPLRDAFAVLFFVSAGMLFNPSILIEEPIRVAAVVGVIVLGKGLSALAITTLFRLPFATGLVIAVSLAQIGEFSFVLVGLARDLDLMSAPTYDLVLGGALLSIALNPFLFQLSDRLGPSAIMADEEVS